MTEQNMAFKVQVGPPQLSIHEGQTILISELDGQINPPSDKGLFFRDTRLISNWSIYANGEPWTLLNGGAITYYAARIFLTNRAFATENGIVPERVLGLTIGRRIGGGMHEDIEITNNSSGRVSFQLEVAVRSDFADVFEVKSKHIVRRGRIATEWSQSLQRLRTSYRNGDFHRAIVVLAASSSSKVAYANGRLSFEVNLQQGEAWHTCLLYTLEDGATSFGPPSDCLDQNPELPHAKVMAEWLQSVAKIQTSNEEFYRMFRRALEDMAALRFPVEVADRTAFMPAAGLPWFVAPFGRDALIVSLQNILIYPNFARGALEFLGSRQASADDPYRDAEPGKILHELRYGELAHFKLIPHTPYYGTADATPLYLITLHAAWRATGDRALLERHMDSAESCLAWIDKYGDCDGDGLQEYQTRSPAGYENMSWKDSGDCIVYPDGSLVKGPKALCELQGYVYDAWLRTAEVFDALGKSDRARKLRAKAATLFDRFNAEFWDEELGFYALALDGNKNKVLSVASNAGHCLYSGIVPAERAEKVKERLMSHDMWTGWGIRTLSASHPAFNPYNYQTGSVWPHDNAIIALGFKRYGFHEEAARIAHDISKAASCFRLNQLPELYTAFPRDETTFPVQYIGANVPQAWAAGAVFMLTQAMLGFMPDASNNKLYVDPSLPVWLPDLTIQDIRVGHHKVTIRFLLGTDETHFEVISGDANVVERREFRSGFATSSEATEPIRRRRNEADALSA
jgi:glycogen debranching enzyme